MSKQKKPIVKKPVGKFFGEPPMGTGIKLPSFTPDKVPSKNRDAVLNLGRALNMPVVELKTIDELILSELTAIRKLLEKGIPVYEVFK